MPTPKEEAVKTLQNAARGLFAKKAVERRKIENNQKKAAAEKAESTQPSLEIDDIKIGMTL